MRKSTPRRELQASASEGKNETPEERAQREHESGMGGSYSVDPATGAVTLAERTAAGQYSRKAPLTDADGNVVAENAHPRPWEQQTEEAAGDTASVSDPGGAAV